MIINLIQNVKRIGVLIAMCCLGSAGQAYEANISDAPLILREGWKLVPSANLPDEGEKISAPAPPPTEARLAALKKTKELDPQLETLLFQYGRYLMIASSRQGGLPANLQGKRCNSKRQRDRYKKSGTSAMCPYRFLVGMARRAVRLLSTVAPAKPAR